FPAAAQSPSCALAFPSLTIKIAPRCLRPRTSPETRQYGKRLIIILAVLGVLSRRTRNTRRLRRYPEEALPCFCASHRATERSSQQLSKVPGSWHDSAAKRMPGAYRILADMALPRLKLRWKQRNLAQLKTNG
ncbi:MAG: hypothetical protein BJ554DRAFT_3773, partial [Olpidium bornovanus]